MFFFNFVIQFRWKENLSTGDARKRLDMVAVLLLPIEKDQDKVWGSIFLLVDSKSIDHADDHEIPDN